MNDERQLIESYFDGELSSEDEGKAAPAGRK